VVRDKRIPVYVAAALALIAYGAESIAQSMQTENTYALDDPGNQPAATLDEVAWLAGSWTGEGFGEKVEETWSPPSGGSMVGMFKLFNGDDPAMYELFVAVEEKDSLIIKLKHFGADFKGWEAQDEYVSFPLVKIEENAAHFAGLSYHRISNNELHTYLAFRSQGQLREEKLVFKRRRPN
jgi:hypothetical protein